MVEDYSSMTLTSVHYQLLLERKTAIETKFDVTVNIPREQNSSNLNNSFSETSLNQSVTVNGNGIFLIFLAGKRRNVAASKKYITEALVYPEIVEIQPYHKDLKKVFSCKFWKGVIERTHDVCISDGTDNELSIAGNESSVSCAALYPQELSNLYCSCVACPTLNKGSTYGLCDVLRNFKSDSDFSFLSSLPDDVNGLLFSWLKEAYSDFFLNYNSPEDLNNSVVVLNNSVPSSKIPVITIDSDDDENCYKQDQQQTLISRKKKRKARLKMRNSDKMQRKQNIFNTINLCVGSSEAASTSTFQLENNEIQGSCSLSKFPDFIPLCTKRNAATSFPHAKANVKKKKRKFQSPPALSDCIPLKTQAEEEPLNVVLKSEIVRKLRPIVIDGSNVAMAHGGNKMFSWRGIALCVEYFEKRGHTSITVFVPQSRRHHYFNRIEDKAILDGLIEKNTLVFTPSRKGVDGGRITCYDDRFIIDLASRIGGVIVSNDAFLDLVNESPEWKEIIKERVLMFCFAGDILMFPDDPLGLRGPRLKEFLCFADE